MTQINKKLTRRQRLFCVYYAGSGDAAQAARRAGYGESCADIGEELLCRADILDELGRLCSLRSGAFSRLAALGYQRLAFGSIADAVSLLYRDSPAAEELKQMDLFLVSEIRKPRDGSIEIKFFDRLKALEKLAEHSDATGAGDLFDAIGRGAREADGDGCD